MNCEQFNELLVDYLYKSLDARSSARVDKHLRTCQACHRLAASYSRTLSKTREALTGPLAETPPSRVRFRALAAAKEYEKAKHRPTSFFARLLRAPWFLPTCGAAAVGIVTLLVYTNKNAVPLPGMPPRALDEQSSAPEAIPSPPKAPTATKEGVGTGPTPSSQSGALENKAMKRKNARGSTKSKEREESRVQAVDPDYPAELEEAPLPHNQQERWERPPVVVPTPAPAKAIIQDKSPPQESDSDDKIETPTLSRPRAIGGSAGLEGAPGAASAPAPKRSYAQPPPAPAVAAPEPSMEKAAAPSSAPVRQRESAPAKSKGVRDDSPAMEELSKDEESSNTRRKQDGEKKSSVIADAIARAENYFADRQWSAAAQAYQELLARYPSHADAPRWRIRLSQARAAMNAE